MAGLWVPPMAIDLGRERVLYGYNKRFKNRLELPPSMTMMSSAETAGNEETEGRFEDNKHSSGKKKKESYLIPLPPKKSLFAGTLKGAPKKRNRRLVGSGQHRKSRKSVLEKSKSSRETFKKLPSARKVSFGSNLGSSSSGLDNGRQKPQHREDNEDEVDEKVCGYKYRLSIHRKSIQLMKQKTLAASLSELVSHNQRAQEQPNGTSEAGEEDCDDIFDMPMPDIPGQYLDAAFIQKQFTAAKGTLRANKMKSGTNGSDIFLGSSVGCIQGVGINKKRFRMDLCYEQVIVDSNVKIPDQIIDLSARNLHDLNVDKHVEPIFRKKKKQREEDWERVTLNLSGNRLSWASVPELKVSGFESLHTLMLSNNQISDTGCRMLLETLGQYQRIQVLDLSYNQITSAGFMEALIRCKSLRKVDFAWNALGARGIGSFATLLKASSHGVQDLNLSNNRRKGSTCPVDLQTELCGMEKFANALGENKNLLHLNISYNFFGRDAMEILSKALSKNHTLFGIHLEGNMARVDARGSIIPLDWINEAGFSRNCWVCEEWKPVRFCLSLAQSQNGDDDDEVERENDDERQDKGGSRVKVHLPHFNWGGVQLTKRKREPGQLVKSKRLDLWETTLVLPVHDQPIYYYYTINDEPHLDDSQPMEIIQCNLVSDDRSKVVDCGSGTQHVLQYESNDFYNCSEAHNFMFPRLGMDALASKIKVGEMFPWRVEVSNWKTRVGTNPDIFAFDWNMACQVSWFRSRMENLILNNEEIKAVIERHYSYLVHMYYQYASQSAKNASRIHELNLPGFLLLLSDGLGLDFWNATTEEYIKVGELFGAIVASSNSKTMARYELIVVIMCCALNEYENQSEADTRGLPQAVDDIVMKFRTNCKNVEDPSRFRDTFLYKEKIDAWFTEKRGWIQNLMRMDRKESFKEALAKDQQIKSNGEGDEGDDDGDDQDEENLASQTEVQITATQFVELLQTIGLFHYNLLNCHDAYTIFMCSCYELSNDNGGEFHVLKLPDMMEAIARLALFLPDLSELMPQPENDETLDAIEETGSQNGVDDQDLEQLLLQNKEPEEGQVKEVEEQGLEQEQYVFGHQKKNDKEEMEKSVEAIDLLKRLENLYEFSEWFQQEMREMNAMNEFWSDYLGRNVDFPQEIWSSIVYDDDVDIVTQGNLAKKLIRETCNMLSEKIQSKKWTTKDMKSMERQINTNLAQNRENMTKRAILSDTILLSTLVIILYPQE